MYGRTRNTLQSPSTSTRSIAIGVTFALCLWLYPSHGWAHGQESPHPQRGARYYLMYPRLPILTSGYADYHVPRPVPLAREHFDRIPIYPRPVHRSLEFELPMSRGRGKGKHHQDHLRW